jgi:hypothetical protein
MLWELDTIVTYARYFCLFCTGPWKHSVCDTKMKIHTLSCRFCSYCYLHIFKLQLVPLNFISLLWCVFSYCYVLICVRQLSIPVAPHDWHVFIYFLLYFLLHCINIIQIPLVFHLFIKVVNGTNVSEPSNQLSVCCPSFRNSLCPGHSIFC